MGVRLPWHRRGSSSDPVSGSDQGASGDYSPGAFAAPVAIYAEDPACKHAEQAGFQTAYDALSHTTIVYLDTESDLDAIATILTPAAFIFTTESGTRYKPLAKPRTRWRSAREQYWRQCWLPDSIEFRVISS